MLAESLLAALLVVAPVDEPAPVSPVDGIVDLAGAGTETAVTVTPLDGGLVRVGILVVGADGSVPSGGVVVRDDGRTVAQVPLTDGRATLVTGAVGEGVAVTAAYTGDAEHLPSASPAPRAGAAAAQDGVPVTVSIPAGALTISLVADRPDTLRVTDTRAGERGFTVSAAVVPMAARRAPVLGLAVRPVQVAGMALQAEDAVSPPVVLLSSRPSVVLTYPSQADLGSLDLHWRVLGCGGARPTSVVWTVL